MKRIMFLSTLTLMLATFSLSPALAYSPLQVATDAVGLKTLAAAIAFAFAALAAGWAIANAGSAGLASAAERLELRTTAIIISALGEALAIYGIVVAILILGAK